MEFYATYAYSLLLVAHLVSIPMGWNSTIMQLSAYDDDISFNSQRDGILRNFFKNKTEQSQRFQFPMGWNSTQSRSLFYSYGKVSIPNGMEFYFPDATINFGFSISFNSQRDGILPLGEEHFQKGQKGFNSQRDGILLKLRKKLIPARRFQFPTGWNSTNLG